MAPLEEQKVQLSSSPLDLDRCVVTPEGRQYMASITAENVVPLYASWWLPLLSPLPSLPISVLSSPTNEWLSLPLIKQYIYFRRNMWLALSQQKTICGAKEGERVDVIVGAPQLPPV